MNPTEFRPMLRLAGLAAVLALAGCERQDEQPVAETGPASAEPTAEVSSPYDIPEVPEPGFDTDRFVEDMKTLASDEFEGRAPGSRGEDLTVDHLVEQMAEAGLEPGFGESYLQPVPMVELTNQERSALSVEMGDESFELTYPEDMIIGSRRLGTDPHGVEDSELVFVGYGIVAPEYDWNDYAGLDVDGKTVVILVNDPGFADPDSGLFNGRAMTYYGRWTYKYEEAARQGAAAALIVRQHAIDRPALLFRALGVDRHRSVRVRLPVAVLEGEAGVGLPVAQPPGQIGIDVVFDARLAGGIGDLRHRHDDVVRVPGPEIQPLRRGGDGFAAAPGTDRVRYPTRARSRSVNP